jgi:hypothetical protein
MADQNGVRVVEIRAGTSPRTVLELRPGQTVQPLSIGRVGMWPIEAPSILDVHAFLYFDGRALFFQSADPSQPARGNGQTIGVDWQQVEIPCTIEIGRARLVYRTLEVQDQADVEEIDDLDADEEDKTIAAPLRAVVGGGVPQRQPGPGASGPFRPGEFSNRHQPDDESTRFSPINREPQSTLVSPLEARGGGSQRPRPAAGNPGIPNVTPAAGMPASPGTVPTPWVPGNANDDYDPPSSTTVGPPPQGAPVPPPPQGTGYTDMGNVQIAMPAPPPPGYGAPQPGYGPPGAPDYGQPQPGMPMQQPGMQPGYGPGGYPQQPTMPPSAAETGRVQAPPPNAKPPSEWEQMPLMRKIILAAMPVAIVAVYFLLFVDDPEPPRPTTKLRPDAGMEAGAATASVATTAPTVTATAPTTTATATDSVPTGTVVATAPTATVSAPPTTTGTATAPPTASTAATAPTLKKGEVTVERRAAEALRKNDKATAIQLYEQLAADHPDNPVYKETVRILKSE